MEELVKQMTTRTGRAGTGPRDETNHISSIYRDIAWLRLRVGKLKMIIIIITNWSTGDGELQRNALAWEGSLILFFGDQSTAINLFIHLGLILLMFSLT